MSVAMSPPNLRYYEFSNLTDFSKWAHDPCLTLRSGELAIIDSFKFVCIGKGEGLASPLERLSNTLDVDLRDCATALSASKRLWLFDFDYYRRISARCSYLSIHVNVNANDFGVSDYFGCARDSDCIPFREWRNVVFTFRNGRLANLGLTLAFFAGHNLEVTIAGSKNRESALFSELLAKYRQQFIGVQRCVVYKYAGRTQGAFNALNFIQGSVMTHSVMSSYVEHDGGVVLGFVYDNSLEALLDKRARVQTAIANGLRILSNEVVPYGYEPVASAVDKYVLRAIIERGDSMFRLWLLRMQNTALALLPLELPAYVVLWILELAETELLTLNELDRINLLQAMVNRRRRIIADRDNVKSVKL